MGACNSSPKKGGWALTGDDDKTVCSLSTVRKPGNPHDRFSVAVRKGTLTVGHLPRETSMVLLGGTITCRVTGRQRRSPLEQGGLEITCELIFSGGKELVAKLKKLFK